MKREKRLHAIIENWDEHKTEAAERHQSSRDRTVNPRRCTGSGTLISKKVKLTLCIKSQCDLDDGA